MATASGAPPPAMDEKARRTRDLLASFYNTDPSAAAAAGAAAPASLARPSPTAAPASPLDSINSTSFDPEIYMNVLVQQSNLEGLLQRHVKMAAEIKNLDTDLQMLVYENYNKFISATDTIKRMKTNIVGMEANMEQLLSKFIYDLPSRLNKCIKTEAYADAVKFFTGAKPIFEAYGDTSFQDCKKASEEAMDLVIQHLQAKLYSDSEPIEARAEAVVLLKQLKFPVDNLKSNLLEKLEDCLLNLQNEPTQASIGDISKTFRAYLIIFPDSERRLIELAQALFSNRYETVRENLKKRISSTDLLAMLRSLWEDATAIDEVIPEAALPAFSLETTRDIIRQHIATAFLHLQSEISDALVRTNSRPNEKLDESQLQTAMDTSKIKVSQGCIDLLQELASSFSGGGARSYEYGPPFVPGEICRLYRSSGEKFLHHQYINMKTQKISKLLNKRFTTPVWIKHKEPREVNMFVDLLLLEYIFSFIYGNITQLLSIVIPCIHGKFQESVISTVLKLCLKSLQEFVRLQTFNRSGFQQIQLDMEFLKSSLKEFVDDEAAISFLLKEVNNAAHERSHDPIPLEPPILDKLINAKLTKIKEQNQNMQ
nr:unnamed protein product [Digitaria exilis]